MNTKYHEELKEFLKAALQLKSTKNSKIFSKHVKSHAHVARINLNKNEREDNEKIIIKETKLKYQ